MAPKRKLRSRRPPNKRKKFNLITLRQKNDFRTLGESHPADTEDTVKSYTKIDDKPKREIDKASSSDSEEEEVPALKQLLDVIGAKEEVPESEEEDEGESSEQDSSEVEDEDLSVDESDDGFDNDSSEEEDQTQEKVNGNGIVTAKDKRQLGKSEVSEYFDDEAEEDDGLEEDDESADNDFINDESDEEDFDSNECSDVDNEKSLENKCDAESDQEDFFEHAEKREKEEPKDKQCNSKKPKGNASSMLKQPEKMDSDQDDNNEIPVNLKESDPFSQHFEIEIEEADLIGESSKWEKKNLKVPSLGKGFLMYKNPHHIAEINVKSKLKELHVKHKLCDQLSQVIKQTTGLSSKTNDGLSPFQHRLFCVLNSYQDLLYPKQDFNKMEEIRLVYCLHALNHALKTRSRIIAHNAKLKSKTKAADDDIEYRDQGLTRPKVLILLPYRDRALKVFKMLLSLLSAAQKIKVSNRKRFETEFSEIEKREVAGKRYKSDDFIRMFEGNIDDNFRVGMSISKKSLRLYSPFYESDIILASPLGLRTVVGNEGDAERDFDFLSSIEMLIMDQTDVFLMQNWDHVSHIFKHLHLQPKETHGTDFSRVRMWAIDGLSKHFRQTIVLSNVLSPEIMTIFNKQCHNYTGKLLIQRDVKMGTIGSCISDAAQIFHRVPCDKPDGMSQRNAKLDYMKKKIIPHHTSKGMNQTLIYCNYFSFVSLRNYFREAEVDFLFINEYDSEKSVSRTRVKFRKKNPHFMLYTERLHFHHRFRLKGVHHIIWFDVPQYPEFYPEIANLLEVTEQTCTTTCLLTKYDGQKLFEIVGQRRAAHMINSEKSVHMVTVS